MIYQLDKQFVICLYAADDTKAFQSFCACKGCASCERYKRIYTTSFDANPFYEKSGTFIPLTEEKVHK